MDSIFLRDFFLYQKDYILFFYGASLCTLAAACFVMKRREEEEEEEDLPWALLAAFGLLHGFHAWLEIVASLAGGELFLEISDSLLLVASCAMLLEFGRCGNPILKKKGPWWIIIPLLAVTAGSWFKLGWPGVHEAAIFFLLFPGGLLAAWALFSASRRRKLWPRYLLAACSLLLVLYVMETILFSQIPYWSDALPNRRLFTKHGVLTSELIKGILCMGMALILSLYSQSAYQSEAMLHYFRRRSRLAFWLSTCLVILLIISGWFFVQYLDDIATRKHKDDAAKNVELMNNKWLFFVDALQRDVQGIAGSASAVDAAASGGKNRQRAAADLEDYRMKHPVEVCFLLDAKGKVIVSSVLAGTKSIMGEDFSHRPYVEHPLSGGEGSYVDFDPATGKSAYFASYPIYGKQGAVIGLAVIKENIERAVLNFDTQPDFAFLVSLDGTIFFSSHAQMAGMKLWPPDKESMAKQAVSREYGAKPLKALLRQEVKQGDSALFEGRRYLVTRRFVMEPANWAIVFLSVNRELATYRVMGIVVVVLFFSLTLGFFIVFEKSLASSAQIAVAENRFRTLFESAPGAIFIIERGTRKILSANNFMAGWLDYRPDELLSMTLDDLRVDGEEAACRYRKRNGVLIHVEEVRSKISFRGHTAYLIIAHDIDDRKKTEELLKTISMSDGLTGIANRRRFDEFLDQGWRRAMRTVTEISLLMCDIDFFKDYNDAYGHQAGDDCLKRVALAIRDNFHRADDLAARYGGEEFAVIIPGTDAPGALSLAEAVRASVEALGIPHNASAVSSVVTISAGIATIKAQIGSTAEALLAAADRALYQAKKEGRNRVAASLS